MTESDIVIRPAVRDDLVALDRFVRELAAEEGLPAMASRDDLAAALFDDGAFTRAVVAEVDGQPVGFALFYAKYSTVTGRRGLHLEDVYVLPQFRDRHAGSAMFAYLQREAGPRGMVDFWVLRSNEPALGFYRLIGAHELDGIAVWRLDDPTVGGAGPIAGMVASSD